MTCADTVRIELELFDDAMAAMHLAIDRCGPWHRAFLAEIEVLHTADLPMLGILNDGTYVYGVPADLRRLLDKAVVLGLLLDPAKRRC